MAEAHTAPVSPKSDIGGPIAVLGSSLRGELLQPGDADYDGARQIWNGMFDKKPALIARCRGTADVIDAVNFARENGLLTAVRCGGHNSSGSGSCDGGILIDLSAMNAVHVDPKRGRVSWRTNLERAYRGETSEHREVAAAASWAAPRQGQGLRRPESTTAA